MPNRLAHETSPYLLQHAENPVDWYPWGDEALTRAREEDRPILLSIGYSACHWCHVMERESFEDEGTATLMNEAFVNVKVDREERPDVDAVYMRAVQVMTGQGGWPLTVFLTPDGRPYYGGTYFPPEPRQGLPSFRQVVEATRDAWQLRREEVAQGAAQMLELLARSTVDRQPEGKAALDPSLLGGAFRFLAARFDPAHGGFGDAPKFPQPMVLELLLRYHLRTGHDQALDMVAHTLRRMARGGIHDHLAGGFHRYTVDGRWLVPHFEKMLYDNALLARTYLHAWQVGGDAELRQVVEGTLDWVLEELGAPEGGFCCALDADSEGEEGRYYVWTVDEVMEVLGEGEGNLFARAYDVSAPGNWEGKNVLHLPHDLEALARSEGTTPEELGRRLEQGRARLLEARKRRVPPLRDEKVLTSWSALFLRVLAEAGAALETARYVDRARAGARFFLDEMRRDGRLLHVWTDGEAKVPGFLEDYAALGNALLTLYETTLEPEWLPEVRCCVERVLDLFWDEGEEAFFDASAEGEALLMRPRDVVDGATPSGTSLAVELLLRTAHLFADERYRKVALAALHREAGTMEQHPMAFGRLLSLVDAHLATPVEVAVLGARDDEATQALLAAVHRRYIPDRTLAGRAPGESPPEPLPILDGKVLLDGHPTAYVCRNYTCEEPITDPQALADQLLGLRTQ